MAIEIDVQPTAEELRLIVQGELTAHTAHRLLEVLKRQWRGHRSLALDLSGVQRMDSAGAATLVELLRRARARNTSLRLLALSEAVKKRLQLVRVLELFQPLLAEPQQVA